MILQPNAHAVRGFDAVMPSYSGLVGDDELLRLSAYIRSLGRPENGDHG
jgi:cytochrome c oxidase subunit II